MRLTFCSIFLLYVININFHSLFVFASVPNTCFRQKYIISTWSTRLEHILFFFHHFYNLPLENFLKFIKSTKGAYYRYTSGTISFISICVDIWYMDCFPLRTDSFFIHLSMSFLIILKSLWVPHFSNSVCIPPGPGDFPFFIFLIVCLISSLLIVITFCLSNTSL